MKFKHINEIEKATQQGQNELFRFGVALLFIIGVMLYSSTLEIAADGIPSGGQLAGDQPWAARSANLGKTRCEAGQGQRRAPCL